MGRWGHKAVQHRCPLIIELGTQVDDETWFMCNRDVSREIESLKREIHRLERLANCKVVMRGGRVITALTICLTSCSVGLTFPTHPVS